MDGNIFSKKIKTKKSASDSSGVLGHKQSRTLGIFQESKINLSLFMKLKYLYNSNLELLENNYIYKAHLALFMGKKKIHVSLFMEMIKKKSFTITLSHFKNLSASS